MATLTLLNVGMLLYIFDEEALAGSDMGGTRPNLV